MTEGGGRAREEPVVYIMSRFPLLTETFILREMLELERQGLRLVVFPLLRARQAVRHAEVERLRAEVLYTPFLSLPIVRANLHYLRRGAGRYLRLLWRVLAGNWGSTNLFAGAVGIFPKAVYFARLVEERGAAHVHAHFATHPALAALVVSELTGVGYSFTAHAHDIFLHEHMLAEKAERSRFVVSISEFNKRYILERAPRVSPDRIKVVHCGIEPDKYDARPRDPGGESGPPTALCVASLQPYKGIRYLIRACALVSERVPGFRCLIVGEGADRPELEALVAELGLRETVRLLGARPQHEVTSLLRDADLFVLPSVVAPTGQMEGIPVALMEAMASRLPVVSTRLSGIPELVEDGVSGLLVPPADEAALAEAITTLCSDTQLRQRLGERGREKVVEEFDLRESVARLRALFEESARGVEDALDREVVEWAKGKFARPPGAGGRAVNGDGVHFSRLGGGRDSEVFELVAEGAAAGKNLILKLHRPNWARPEEAIERGREHAGNEFRALSFLWGEFSRRSERLAVPRPVDFEPGRAALLIEKCPGEKLERAMRFARFKADRLSRLPQWFAACGEWLATFHLVTARDGDPRPVYERIEREFYAELEACRGAGLQATLASRAARRFEERKATALDGSHKLVGRHCDFAPYNILVADDKLTVIDFEGLQEGVLYDDLCYFLGMVEATPPYHLSRALKKKLGEEFLKAYARQGGLDRSQLDFYMLAAMVKIMAHSPVLRRGGATWLDALKRRQRLGFYNRWFRETLT